MQSAIYWGTVPGTRGVADDWCSAMGAIVL